MAYDVTKTDGTRLTIVADRQVDTTTPIKLLGKNYSAYGEIMAENLMLEHFSNPVAPGNPIIGQAWWNSVEGVLYVYGRNGWNAVGGENVMGNNTNGFNTAPIKDTVGNYHPATKIVVNHIIIAIMSSDNGSYTPHADTGLASSFPNIGQGINLNYSEQYGNFKLRGRAIEAEFADMAEIYCSDIELVPGNLVRLGGSNEITKTTEAFDIEVFGVISTAPGFLLNSKAKLLEHAYPVALKGRVPCIVKGTVKKGQRIVASDVPGVGMVTDDLTQPGIVGRAIESKDYADIGTVEVAIGAK
jgi:hypothetical protein